MKRMALMVLILCLVWIPSGVMAAKKKAVSTDATFTSVKGTVTVKSKKGTTKSVQQGDKASQGETVTVAKGGGATLQFFDGSTLDLKSNTRIVLSTLKQPSSQDKKLGFKLMFGELLAKVKKLLTPKSSFEVEAGGVVCGVRGTAYTISYDPATGDLIIKVSEGSVKVVDKNGNVYIIKAGEEMEFVNGKPKNESTSSDNNDNGGSDQDSVTLALDDLVSQFQSGVQTNSDKNFSDSNGQGPVKVNVQVQYNPNE